MPKTQTKPVYWQGQRTEAPQTTNVLNRKVILRVFTVETTETLSDLINISYFLWLAVYLWSK